MFYCVSTAALAVLLVSPALAQDPAAAAAEPARKVTGGVTGVSQYRFRGIGLSDERFAIQGTINLNHESGFYASGQKNMTRWPAGTGAGEVVTHSHLLRTIWGPAHQGDLEYIRVAARGLRKKLEEDPSQPRLIRNEPAVGYRLVDPSR